MRMHFFCILVLAFVFFIFFTGNPTVYGQNTVTKEGYLNVAHGHFSDGTSFYEFHLFDEDTFTQPPVLLDLTNYSGIKNILSLAGNKIKVTGVITETSTDPKFQKMLVEKIQLKFGATIELDQKVYTWTDKVYITIVAPDHNLKPSDKDVIGGPGNPIKISTRSNDLDDYKLVETGTDTGIFTGEVILTGFTHDADGKASTGDGHGFDTNPRTLGNGPTGGFLEADSDDGITISFEWDTDETVVGSALIRWHIGEVQWLQASYSSIGTGVVRVIDPDMNLDPEAVDDFDVDVWSDSDAGGIDLTVTETDKATGIFEGTVFFTVTDESSGHRLRVAEGDTVTAEYEDNTLPDPYTTADELDITGVAMIDTSIDLISLDNGVKIKGDFLNINYDDPLVYYKKSQNSKSIDLPEVTFLAHYSTNPRFPPSLHTINSLTIPLKFNDVQNTPHTPEYYQDKFYDDPDSLSSYFAVNSYGKVEITGETLNWITLENNREYYIQDNALLQAILAENATKLIDSEIKFTGNDNIENKNAGDLWNPENRGDDIDSLIFIMNDFEESEEMPSWAYLHPRLINTEEGKLYVFQSFHVDRGSGYPLGSEHQKGYGIPAHEFGHFFHWYHTPLLSPHDVYSDPWSLLSGWNDNSAPSGIVSYQKRKANWIEPTEVIHVLTGQSKKFELDFLNNPSDSQNRILMAEIPLEDGKFYTVEARKDSKFDHIPESEGLMIYQFNPDGYKGRLERTNTHDENSVLTAARQELIDCEISNGRCEPTSYGILALQSGQSHKDQNDVVIKLHSSNKDSMSVCVSNKSQQKIPIVSFTTNDPILNKPLSFTMEFEDCLSEERIHDVEYDLVIKQDDQILLEKHSISVNGIVSEATEKPIKYLPSDQTPIEVSINYNSDIEQSESIHIVPEFETLTILVLFSSIIFVILLTTKTNLNWNHFNKI